MSSDRVVNSKGLYGWIDKRFPLTPLLKNHLAEYYAPKNFNFWYFFGSLATVILVLQIVTGILLVMHYKPDASLNSAGIPVAFASVEYIMREVPFGWLIRYMHSTGASAFFVVVCACGPLAALWPATRVAPGRFSGITTPPLTTA